MSLNKITNKIMNKIKEFRSKDNELMIIGLIFILIFFWLILYVIPSLFVDLFNTILGKAILILSIILVSFKNLYYGMLLLVVFVIVYRFINLSNLSNIKNSKIKEGFTWNDKSTNEFLDIQKLINPEIVFNLPEIQKQASQKDVTFFNKNGIWPWSEKIKELYSDALEKNPYIRTSTEDAINTTSTIYNENAISEMLSWQSKEGQFLLNGVSVNTGKSNPYEDLPSGWGDYAYNSKQISKNNNVIKCGYKNKNNNPTLQEIEYKGNDGILNSHVKEIKQIDYNDLEKKIPGFTFLKGPCDPCQALNNSPNYNCPFELNIRGVEKGVSPIWKYLWDL
jgi:hypothetical protein